MKSGYPLPSSLNDGLSRYDRTEARILIGRSRVRPPESSLRIWNMKRTRTPNLGERTVAREAVGDKDNSVDADSILWFESDETVAWASAMLLCLSSGQWCCVFE
jgi:hypothetical protein